MHKTMQVFQLLKFCSFLHQTEHGHNSVSTVPAQLRDSESDSVLVQSAAIGISTIHSLSLSLSLSPHHPLSPTLLLLDFLSSTFKTAYKVMTNSDTQWKGKEGWWPSFISIIPGRLSYFLNSTLEHWAWTNKQKTHTRRYHNVVILILKAPNKALFSKMTRLLVSTTDRSDESNPLLTNHLSVTHPQFSPRQSVSSFPYTTFPSAAGHDPRYTYLSAFVTGSKLLQFRLYSMTCIQTGIGTHASV